MNNVCRWAMRLYRMVNGYLFERGKSVMDFMVMLTVVMAVSPLVIMTMMTIRMMRVIMIMTTMIMQ